MLCTFQVLPTMRKRQQGCIINIASRAGTVPIPFSGAYCTGKGAVIRAVSCLQKELDMDGLGDGIHVYALHPGATLSQESCKFPIPWTLRRADAAVRRYLTVSSGFSQGCCRSISCSSGNLGKVSQALQVSARTVRSDLRLLSCRPRKSTEGKIL